MYFDSSSKEYSLFPNVIQATLANIYGVHTGEYFVSRVAEWFGRYHSLAHEELIYIHN